MQTSTLRRSIVATLLFLPLAALALNYTDSSGSYTDSPFSRSERAAISVLTNAGVVHGNPDGTFAPNRTLNRAEFVTIALRSVGATDFAALNCFPDVQVDDWFSPFVCEAKQRSVVSGYPDGNFKPSKNVNYAEALKILATLYGYPIEISGPWYKGFVDAANEHGTGLAAAMDPAHFLTRGEMARLTAAFLAESKGELATYRAAEGGKIISSSSSSMSSQTSSSISSISSTSSSSTSSSSSSSSSIVSTLPDFPSKNRFLMPGETTQPLLGGGFSNTQEALIPTQVRVLLAREIKSFDTLFLIDESGTVITQLTLDTGDITHKTWKGSIGTTAYRIPKNVNRVLGIIARMKPEDQGFISQELVEATSFLVTFQGVDSNTSYLSPPANQVYPQHQTAFGVITGVQSFGPQEGVLSAGTNLILGQFGISGLNKKTGNVIHATELNFTILKSPEVAVSNWKLLVAASGAEADCYVSNNVVSCPNLPVGIGNITSPATVLELHGDVLVSQGATNAYLQVTLQNAGSINAGGDIRWNDGAGEFSWVPLTSPIVNGTRWHE